ncbi:MAG: undecaprenyldiphospho-muramoylpentapeptide beta-N-acetylglucosaminyltransferase [Ponticaulis sp.]|nr:undecaprenyldiphospho-muramoylpentapeptide beta-N-acetylglucosaminyltransferase [Ponticaulis sp.]|tara:strand:- start:52479 stop:53570 length:1092 start_codon:yes stop_codon:yes gene_type:complete
MTASKLVVIGAGGTGGHMFPASAFAAEMKSRGWRVGLMTDDRGRRYTDGFPADWIVNVKAATFASKRPDKLLTSGLKIYSGIGEAKKKLKAEGADLVAGFGGYPAFPALMAASQLKTPIIIHEQNAVLGRVNRFFAKKAEIVACGFERLDRLPAGAHMKVVGNPVRKPILDIRDAPYPATGADDRLQLLITGGSQGARLFGEVLPPAICALPDTLRSRLRVVQQVREEQLDEVTALYQDAGIECELAPFFSNMPELLAGSHLVICRSGASSVTELAVVGRPAILIPLAIAMDDHQTGNAETLAAAGAADVVSEAQLSVEAVTNILANRLSDSEGLKARAEAAKSVGMYSASSDLADLAEGLEL